MFMLAGKVNSAMRLLDNSSSSGIFGLSKGVLKDVTNKHSPSALPDDSVVMTGEAPFLDPVMKISTKKLSPEPLCTQKEQLDLPG